MSRKNSRSGSSNPTLSKNERKRLEQRLKSTEIKLLPITSLVPNARNAKRHPERQIALLAENIRQFGFTQPIIVDETFMVLAGHGRLAAAKRLAMNEVPVVQLPYLSPSEKRLLALADNKLGELGEWDTEIVAAELEDLSTALEGNLELDMALSGFDTVDFDRLVETKKSKKKDDLADQIPAVSSAENAVTRRGDVWKCGNHALVCGNSLEAETYRALLGDERADIVFTDPPYNVRISGHVSKRSGVREFAMASGEMSSDEFTAFLRNAAGLMADNAHPGAVLYICMDWPHYGDLLHATRHALGAPKNLVVWVKSNAGMGSFYRSQHELVGVFVTKGAPPKNNFKLGARGRYRTNVWEYPGVNALGSARDEALAMHPTVKPTAMVADALKDCSDRGDLVLDPFGGSGTTLIAAERTGRRARLIEIDPLYCDVILRRFQDYTKQDAVHVETGLTFSQRSTLDAVEAEGAGA